MLITLYMRDTVTGATRTYHCPFAYDELADALYVWTDGNFGCDCNRCAFFDLDLPCGARGKNRIVLDRIESDAGDVITDGLNTGGATLFKR